MTIALDLRSALDPVVLFERAFGVDALDWQRGYLREEEPVVLLKGRQIGASLAAASLAVHSSMYHAQTNSIIVSPSLKQSGEILGKARRGLGALGVRLVKDSATLLELRNGSRIVSLPGTARSVRGWTARLLIIDEAAYLEEATWTAARALVATGGRLVVQSTPADEYGPFHELVTGDELGWSRLTVRSDEVSTISAAFLESERRSMAPDAFATEYECRFARAGAGLFTLASIARMFGEEDA
jgi:hypothetical protein